MAIFLSPCKHLSSPKTCQFKSAANRLANEKAQQQSFSFCHQTKVCKNMDSWESRMVHYVWLRHSSKHRSAFSAPISYSRAKSKETRGVIPSRTGYWKHVMPDAKQRQRFTTKQSAKPKQGTRRKGSDCFWDLKCTRGVAGRTGH